MLRRYALMSHGGGWHPMLSQHRSGGLGQRNPLSLLTAVVGPLCGSPAPLFPGRGQGQGWFHSHTHAYMFLAIPVYILYSHTHTPAYFLAMPMYNFHSHIHIPRLNLPPPPHPQSEPGPLEVKENYGPPEAPRRKISVTKRN